MMPIYKKGWKQDSGNYRSSLTNLISFYGKVTHSVDEEKAGNIVCLDFGKVFDTVSQHIPQETGCSWLGCVGASLGQNLAGVPGPKGGSEWELNPVGG